MVKELINDAASAGVFLSLDEAGQLKYELSVDEFPEQLKQKIIQNKNEIIAFFEGLSSLHSSPGYSTQDAIEKASEASVSFAQQRFWLIDNIEGGSAHYNMPGAFQLEGEIDLHAIERAFVEVIQRHEVLRTTYHELDGQVTLQVHDIESFPIKQTSIEHLSAELVNKKLTELLSLEASRSFDLENDLMIRCHLIKLSNNKYVVGVNMHHIASDGWSLGILINEFVECYSAVLEHRDVSLPELPIQYSDFAVWQKAQLRGTLLDQLGSYWKTQLADIPMAHSLPLDKPRPQRPDNQGTTFSIQLPASQSKALKTFCVEQNASLFAGVHALFAALMSRYSNENDVVIGTPVAGRDNAELARLIGLFVNTLVLRTINPAKLSLVKALEVSRNTIFEAFEHQAIPFENLVEILNIERSPAYHPIFQVMLAMQNNDQEALKLPNLALSNVEQPITTTKFDLTVHVREVGEQIEFTWEYATALFNDDTIKVMAGHFNQLITQAVANPNASLDTMPLLTASEYETVVNKWNATSVAYLEDLCMHELFIQQALKTPAAIALVDSQGEMTYFDLLRHALLVASKLSGQITVEELVAVRAEKGRAQVIATLAILIAGGAYLPLETSWPVERCRDILVQAQVKVCLVDSQQQLLSSEEYQYIDLSRIDNTGISTKEVIAYFENYRAPQQINQLAYVIFTSGSTGVPKGVAIEHQAVVNTLLDINSKYEVTHKDKVLCVSALSFDLSVYDIFGMLAVGGVLVFPAPELAKDPHHWLDMLEKHEITVWNTVPLSMGLITELLEADNRQDIAPLRIVLMSGDWIPTSLPKRIWRRFRNAKLFSLGGATEGSIWSIHYPITEDLSDRRSVPYGKPLGNQAFYILNSQLQHCPTGVTGELFIGGKGVAREYYNASEITEKHFLYHPELQQKIYRTGDLGRYLPDGNIEFVGRLDNQLKVRGFRVEIGDIESQLLAHPKVEGAHVVAVPDKSKNIQLVAYVVMTEEWKPSRIREYLFGTLPDYMVPSAIMLLPSFPLTANGKLDRKALPEPDFSQALAEYEAPKNKIEALLCELFAECLGLEKVGRKDNFFSLGGHSVLGMELISKAKRKGIIIEARHLFSVNTLAELADVVSVNEGEKRLYQAPKNKELQDGESLKPEHLTLVNLSNSELESIAKLVPKGIDNIQDIYPLSPVQEGFLFHYMLGADVDPYILNSVIELPQTTSLSTLQQAFEVILLRHDVLRTQVQWQGVAEPVQVVCKEVEFVVDEWEFSCDDDDTDVLEVIAPSLRSKMTISQAPLVNITLARNSTTTKSYLVIQCHHLIVDHAGLEMIGQELAAILNGQELKAPAHQFREQIAFIKEHCDLEAAKAFYKDYLNDVTQGCYPFNLSSVHGDGSDVVQLNHDLSEKLSAEIRALSRAYRVSPAILFHMALSLTISIASASSRVIFGTVMSGRLDGVSGVDKVMGTMINTVPVHLELKNLSAEMLLRKTEACLNELVLFEHVPLAIAQQQSGLTSDTPLFSSLFNYRRSKSESAVQSTLGLRSLSLKETTNYPLVVSVDDFNDKKSFTVEVKAMGEYASRVQNIFASAMASICSALVSGHAGEVTKLACLPSSELPKITSKTGWPKSCKEIPLAHNLFEATAVQTPDVDAVVTTQNTLSFAELNKSANQLANYLRQTHGVKENKFVGIVVNRSQSYVVAVLAVLKCGAAFVPIDPSYPTERVSYICDQANVTVVLGDHDELSKKVSAPFANLDLCIEEATSYTSAPQPTTIDAKSAAYVIFTSGSTGRPKGVVVSHQNLVNHSTALKADILEATGASRWGWTLSGAFDGAMKGISALLNGISLCMVSEQARYNPSILCSELQLLKADIVDSTPVMINEIFRLAEIPQVNWLIGGDAIDPVMWNKVAKYQQSIARKAFNMYGPTECSINTCWGEITTNSSPHIGSPILNVNLSILDNEMRAVPAGVVGELYISGFGVAKGYINSVDDEAFLSQSVCAEAGLEWPVYRSGDLVKASVDGVLQFVGRKDSQVKIRGYRIDLNEVEAAILACNIELAAVTTHEDTLGGTQLLAFYESSDISEQELKERLREMIPSYMLPSVIQKLEQMPINSNGKIDRKALPKVGEVNSTVVYVAPDTEIESSLCKQWETLLGVEKISVEASFFDSGGHSILATRFASFVEQEFKVQLPLSMLFESATVRTIASYIESIQLSRGEVSLKEDEEEFFL
ncbi:non-ribosomal peptide synthetase [Pseudoalteromonas sp. JC28]|uniref:non-ribosomal peptide synthetase n=1 Tax=Pseudoalteromonas sp. JC28 TaxID=2267617 RepID=UPI001573A702|nr:non-ribosomal peptide synthetase [Pseudoalteromonas sp. JC28]